MKTTARLNHFKIVRSGKPVAGSWIRFTRTLSVSLRAMLSWPATVYRARQDMEQLGRMSERELRDIGLIRQDLYDLEALPLSRNPTAMLGLRVHQRRQNRPACVNRFDQSNVAPWGL